MSLYLLDTNIISYLQTDSPNHRLLDRFGRRAPQSCTAAIVVHELLYGVERLPPSRQRSALARANEVMLQTLPVLPYEQRAARWHAAQQGRLARSGRPPPFRDGQIAAIAAVNDAVLVTANVRDFSMFEGLQIETWLK